jgi:hypothetical protein
VSPSRRRAVAAASWLGLAVAACTTPTPTGAIPDASADTAQGVIGTAGGTLSTPDGVLTLAVPPGAVDRDVLFTVGPTPAPLLGAVGAVFEMGPAGTQFAVPATVTIRYTDAERGDAAASDLLVATVVAGLWQPLSSERVDTAARSVAAQTPHLSPFALVTSAALVTPDAGGCAADNAPVGSCSSPPHPLCAGAPGSVLYSCSDDGNDAGYMALCCPPAEAGGPADGSVIPEGAADGDGDGNAIEELPAPADAGDAAAACTTEEVPSGTCAAPVQPLCSDLSGAAPASCIDNPAGAGFTAVCCPTGDAGGGG